jgi:isopenicillin N synthase-like dioxygenase
MITVLAPLPAMADGLHLPKAFWFEMPGARISHLRRLKHPRHEKAREAQTAHHHATPALAVLLGANAEK